MERRKTIHKEDRRYRRGRRKRVEGEHEHEQGY